MQNVLVYLGGDIEKVFAIIIYAYALRAVPLLSPAVPVGMTYLPTVWIGKC